MNSAKFLRRWLPLVIVIVVAVAAWQTAKLADTDTVSTTARPYERDLGTPILSARRVPETLRAPVIDDALVPSVQTIVDGSADFTACVTVQADGRVIQESGADIPLVPASNQKLLTTFAALEELGPDHRFITTVKIDGVVTDGVLDGDLYLIGGGDPFLSTESWRSQYEERSGRFHTRLEDLADAIVESGITTVNGTVIGDESYFDEVRVGPWAQRLIDQRQSGPLSALAVNEGHVEWPDVYSSAINRSTTTEPPLQAADALRSLLSERGVSTGSSGAGVAPATATEIAKVSSPAMVEIITHVNSYSNNYGAEILVKHLGRETTGVGSTRAGADAVLAILSDPSREIDTTNVVVNDGSGLAESNRLTCRLVSDLLDQAGPDSDFARSLSIGGRRGSLLNRHLESPANGQVFAKTGTLNGVTALSGYVSSPTQPGSTVRFTYIANGELAGLNEELRSLQEPFVDGLATFPTGPTIDDLDPEPTTAASP